MSPVPAGSPPARPLLSSLCRHGPDRSLASARNRTPALLPRLPAPFARAARLAPPRAPLSRRAAGGGSRPCARGRAGSGRPRETRAVAPRDLGAALPRRPRHVFSLTSRRSEGRGCRRGLAARHGLVEHRAELRRLPPLPGERSAPGGWRARPPARTGAGGPERARRGRGVLSAAPHRNQPPSCGARPRGGGCGPAAPRHGPPPRGAEAAPPVPPRGLGGARGARPRLRLQRPGRGFGATGMGTRAGRRPSAASALLLRGGERRAAGSSSFVGRGGGGAGGFLCLFRAVSTVQNLRWDPRSLRFPLEPHERGCSAAVRSFPNVKCTSGCVHPGWIWLLSQNAA